MRTGSSPLTRGKPWPARRGHRGSGLIPAHAGKTSEDVLPLRDIRAHPRSRGENIKAAVSVVVEWGSSPLTRGKQGDLIVHARAGRLIPAHAGKTGGACAASTTGWAHPRSRGENSPVSKRSGRVGGSSPLTRGKPHWFLLAFRGGRLIPAHAGKTFGAGDLARDKRAHPRSRGENAAERPRGDVVGGSSPLTRGKRWRGPP